MATLAALPTQYYADFFSTLLKLRLMRETTNVGERPDRSDRGSADPETVASSRGMGLVRVGASSWANPTLLKQSDFYPPSVRTPAERLRFYADRFTREINSLIVGRAITGLSAFV